ncbi:MAG: phosphatidylethanolamine/phosphatidyl-N-methylethanolamine N-methyltransferase [Parcubacteria bacterium C7867-006]|nr:MAG: phosphatidylethanolamine/phosphatidyl-N-methylethanolamine N-methyltransferase [Parcubacteria bacterium C7867-006]
MKESFIVQFFKKWRQIGAIAPSSIFLVEDMLSEVDWDRASIIIELGAGSGTFTKQILKKMRPEAKLFVFEIDHVFLKKLNKIIDSRIVIVSESAENLSKYLDGKKADYVISGIPLSNLDKHVKSGIIYSAMESMVSGGIFLQFQYFPESLNFLKKYFDDVKLKFTFLNTPPAFYYICLKK